MSKIIIIITLMLCFSMISCGKKGDPVYLDPEKKVSIKDTFLNKSSWNILMKNLKLKV